ncbi:SDR family oxidoreductase [Marinitenerispora sediminis]|uniref:SDR family oxidoreductase n=1 Tax=Marinitenerispora sediminis TaxID=1931232 RepID=A0A368T3G7_9ACTN|nr:SDR family oxidoreductase [Marinitenerispora sediminis]RCV49628.1 hypothetical protein DEF28_20245 [Marinitenerispora sediminis]RCV53122.1 hypothetical protein DEF23_18125 [Marinitenerispora sediminis]RCV57166.1 hypothetical protein DEF24_15615 [Marinitenerispora sediminis]
MNRLPPRWTRSGGAASDPIPRHRGAGALSGRRALVVGGLSGGIPLGRTVATALAKEGAAVALAESAARTAPSRAWPSARDSRDSDAARTRPTTGRGRGRPIVPARSSSPLGARPEPATERPDTPRGAGADPLRSTARLLARLGASALPLHCDTADESGCRGAVAHTALEFGGIDLLVVCGQPAPAAGGLLDLTTEDLDRTIRATLYSTLWLVQAARVFMQPGSSVVLTAAPSGRLGSAEGIGHAAGAAAVMNLARSLADALAERDVRVNCAVPEDGDDPHDVAAAYVRLARGGAAAPTGAVLPVSELVPPG